MRRHRDTIKPRRVWGVALAVWLACTPSAHAGRMYPVASPISVPGARVVDLRDANGGVQRITTIPTSSVFRRHGGTDAACRFTPNWSGTTSDGQTFAAGQSVQSQRWIFVEALPVSFGESQPLDPARGRGPLAAAVRVFTVFCDSMDHAVGLIFVPARDPLFDPHQQLANLRNRLQLVRPVVFTNPVVAKWGGLIARYQSWLAVDPSAWAPQRSNATAWRGWTMYLAARPVALDFIVDFTPDRARSSPSFHGVVPCVARGATPSSSDVAVPAMPTLPAQSKPGVNGACRWTPPGPGTVVVQARLTFALAFWVSGYTDSLPDYVWTSRPATFGVGELAAVNTGA